MFTLEDLHFDYIEANSRPFDFSKGWPDDWDFLDSDEIAVPAQDFEAQCTECNLPVRVIQDALHHVDETDGNYVIDPELDDHVPQFESCEVLSLSEGFVDITVFGAGHTEVCGVEAFLDGPVTNSVWPVSFDRVTGGMRGAVVALQHLPLCPVTFGKEEFLALTGGGMDLSWEIAEAYIRLGYLPPASIRLPRMADTRNGKRNQLIVAALRKSLQGIADRVLRQIKDLDALAEP